MRNDIGLSLRVVSGADDLSIRPVDAGISCSSGAPYLWHAFDQDAVTGRITVVNAFECTPPTGMSGLGRHLSDTSYSYRLPSMPPPTFTP
jgi:hypothetical protein